MEAGARRPSGGPGELSQAGNRAQIPYMDLQVAPLAARFDLDTDLLLNCLDGLS